MILQPGETFTLADIAGSGAIQQIWMTLAGGKWRFSILRAYWDDQEQPSIEAPTGDFFASGWESFAQVTSLPVCVNPGRAFNCFWEMPFRKRARFTMTNLADEPLVVYYQINYTLTEVPEDCAYFHAQFRRTNPLPYKDVYTIVDGVKGQGHYAGVYMAWGVNNAGWWGEGEIKFYMDGDDEFPTICRHRHRGLLLRRLQLRSGLARDAPQPGRVALPGVHDAVRGPAAGDPPERRLPVAAALRHVPLARDGPDPLPARPARHDPGARLAHAKKAQYLPLQDDIASVRVLVPDAADRAVPRAPAARPARGDLMRRSLAVLALLAGLAVPAFADWDPELERQEAAQREAAEKEQQRKQAEADAMKLTAMRQFLGAEAEGKSDAEVRRLYDAKLAAYQKQGEAAAATAPTAEAAEKQGRDTRDASGAAVKEMTGKSLEELENMSDEEAEALQRELEKKYGAE